VRGQSGAGELRKGGSVENRFHCVGGREGQSPPGPRDQLMMQALIARALLFMGLALVLWTDLTTLVARFSSPVGPTPQEDVALSSHTNHRTQNEKMSELASTLKNSCLPKLICELNAAPEKDKLTQKAKSLLQLIRDTSISMTAEVSSRYHFAAHMGQLISGVEGTGCHNFYPGCPLPSVKILSVITKSSFF